MYRVSLCSGEHAVVVVVVVAMVVVVVLVVVVAIEMHTSSDSLSLFQRAPLFKRCHVTNRARLSCCV